jgi:hypothetical protein
MAVDEKSLREESANMVENLAIRMAECQGGALRANQLLPWLPMSLAMITACLDDLSDGVAVLKDDSAHIPVYTFTAYTQETPKAVPLKAKACIACDATLASPGHQAFCRTCQQVLQTDLTRLADATGWPAQAVYEHELAYLAAQMNHAAHAEDLSGRSRYTLRNVRQKLADMSRSGYVAKALNDDQKTIVYQFPEITYAQERYRENIGRIRQYPASALEEIQLRLVRIMVSLGVLLLSLFAAAFFGYPFPLLVMTFLVLAPIVSVFIWKRRNSTDETD